MNVKEWSLVAFTILTQMSVGSFLVLGIVHFWAARRSGTLEADKLSDRALLAIGPVLVLGLLASFFHLGNPINAPRAIANLGSSWLSWEILFLVLFTITGAVFALLQWRKIGTPGARNALALVASLFGIGQVYAMSRLYMIDSVPAWNTWATPASFFTTTLLLGVLAMGAAFVTNYALLRRRTGEDESQQELLRISLRWFALVSVALLGIQFVIVPLYVASLAVGGEAALQSANLLVQRDGLIFVARLVLVFLGAGLISILIYRNAISEGRVRVMGNLAYLAFALVLIAEILGRYLFYASFVRVGV